MILTLALGIGANAAIFTLVRGVLLKPLVNRFCVCAVRRGGSRFDATGGTRHPLDVIQALRSE